MGLRGLTGSIQDQSKDAVATVSTQFHWQDPSISERLVQQNKMPASLW